MRLKSIIGEAWRDLISGTTQAALFAAIFVLVVGSLAVVDARSVVGLVKTGAQFSSSGAATEVLKESDGSGQAIVDGTRCDNLSSAAGVSAAGAIRTADQPLTALNLPSDQLTTIEVTPGIIAMLSQIAQPVETVAGGAGGPVGGVWLSSDLAAQLGAKPGMAFRTTAGTTRVAGVYHWPDDSRSSELGYAVLVPVPAGGDFSECWAQVWPQNAAINGLLYTSLTGSGSDAGSQIAVSQLNSSLGARFSLDDALQSRLTALTPVVTTLVGLVLGFFALRLRRLEIASDLHAHARRADILWQVLIETAVWTATGLIICAAGLAFAARFGNPESWWPVWAIGLRSVIVGAFACLLGALAGALSSREKQLFRYFKERS